MRRTSRWVRITRMNPDRPSTLSTPCTTAMKTLVTASEGFWRRKRTEVVHKLFFRAVLAIGELLEEGAIRSIRVIRAHRLTGRAIGLQQKQIPRFARDDKIN